MKIKYLVYANGKHTVKNTRIFPMSGKIIYNIHTQLLKKKAYRLQLKYSNYVYDQGVLTKEQAKNRLFNDIHTRINKYVFDPITKKAQIAIDRCCIALKTDFKEWSGLKEKYNLIVSLYKQDCLMHDTTLTSDYDKFFFRYIRKINP